MFYFPYLIFGFILAEKFTEFLVNLDELNAFEDFLRIKFQYMGIKYHVVTFTYSTCIVW